jgi:formate hydrogenlyase subunit 6/NADH:ubiquinone oxidoreductase subunit I
MRFKMVSQLLGQMFRKPVTNPFPKKYAPKSVAKLLQQVDQGKTKLNPPIEVPPDFRGRIKYDREKCNYCQLCKRVCPAHAIDVERSKEEGKPGIFRIYAARCISCAQCVETCPTCALTIGAEFLFAALDKYEKDMIIE